MTPLREQIKRHFTALQENLYCQDTAPKTSKFENAYLEVRGKEHRLYPDGIVKTLPHYIGNERLSQEWRSRAKSMKRILKYLQSKSSSRTILEIGCGNGWLSHQLAQHTAGEVLGIDINKTEIEQAARVFKETPNVTFLLAEIAAVSLLEKRFDVIILASSIQYFKDVTSLIKMLLPLLTDSGEIHIIDSPVYSPGEVRAARARTEKYFRNLNSSLEDFYFHHSWNSFKEFNLTIRYKPSIFSPFWKKFGVSALPFPWLVVRK